MSIYHELEVSFQNRNLYRNLNVLLKSPVSEFLGLNDLSLVHNGLASRSILFPCAAIWSPQLAFLQFGNLKKDTLYIQCKLSSL